MPELPTPPKGMSWLKACHPQSSIETPPEWVSPADILHMREHDVPSVVPVVPLQYVGHLRCRASLWNGACTEAARVGNSAAAAPLAADALPPADFSDEVR